MHPRTEMLDLVIVDGHAKGSSAAISTPARVTRHAADAVILATGGYGNVFFLSTNAMGCNVMAAFRAHRRGASSPTPATPRSTRPVFPGQGDYQSKLTLMSESLRNDGRCWVPKQQKPGLRKEPADIAEEDRDYYLERKYPSFGNLCPARHRFTAQPRKSVTKAAASAPRSGRPAGRLSSTSQTPSAATVDTIGERYGNLFEMYQRITGENPYEVPMRIYPAVHYTMGGLWVDYNLMSNLPGLHVLGEANFSDHGANRLGASALMQGLADGYFVAPATLPNYLADQKPGSVTTDHPAFEEAEKDGHRPTRKAPRDPGRPAPSTPSTASSDFSAGTTAEWSAARRA